MAAAGLLRKRPLHSRHSVGPSLASQAKEALHADATDSFHPGETTRAIDPELRKVEEIMSYKEEADAMTRATVDKLIRHLKQGKEVRY